MPPAIRQKPGRLPSWGESPSAGERVYAYAKACGIIGKSFVGKRIALLGKPHTLVEFDRLLFPEDRRELPGYELLADLENRILRRTTRQILSVISSYDNPPELLVRQLRSCEYADLKTCLHHLSAGRPAPSNLSDLGRLGTVRFNAYPDLKAMLSGTEFDFILEHDTSAIASPDYDFTRIETELDRLYYTLLLRSAAALSVSDRLLAQRILAEEISLRNCVWVLRLRVYFNKTQEDAAEYLMDMNMHQSFLARQLDEIPGDINPRITAAALAGSASGSEISLAEEAHQMLYFPLDYRDAWNGWRWERLLNPEEAGEAWMVDPRHLQNAASQYLYRLALRCFRRMPFSMSSIFCYIKLKQFEEDLLTSVAEGIGLGMTCGDVFELLEVAA